MQNKEIRKIGIQAGKERSLQHFDLLDEDVEICDKRVEELAEKLGRLFVKHYQEWHPRATHLFSEILTIGVFSRQKKDEPPLVIEDVVEFKGWFEKFVNCWVCK